MKYLLATICAVLVFVSCAVCCRATTPTPSPFDVNAVDMAVISEAEIQATIAHRNALHEMLIQQTLPAASNDVKEAVAKAQDLQKDIDKLALSAARVPVLEAELAKAHKAIWRDIILFTAIGFVLGLLGPKLLGLASMVGV
jgi:exonuclease VII large subunit